MTTLYRPVLIESAEQAEALPRGTVALTSLNGEQASAGKIGDDLWMVAGNWPDYSNEDAVGWTALVPIAAREESMGAAYYPGPFGVRTQRILSRLVTPWEEA